MQVLVLMFGCERGGQKSNFRESRIKVNFADTLTWSFGKKSAENEISKIVCESMKF